MKTITTPFMLAVFLFGACGEKVVTKIDPQTKTDLDNCLEVQKDQKKLIASLQEENTKLQTKQGTSEIVVTIEGNTLTVKPTPGGGTAPPPIPDGVAKAASTEFIDVVRKSRGAIQKCYEQALKKTTGLQSKTVALTVKADFSQAGQYKNASFAPSLGDTFDTCIRAVAAKWVLSQKAPAMSFQATVSLTPS